MISCILAFVGMYTAVLGFALFIVNGSWVVTLNESAVSLSVVCLAGGFLLSVCILAFIRAMGELSGKEDPKVIANSIRKTAKLGFFASAVASIIQCYLRFQYGLNTFLIYKSEYFASALQASEMTDEVVLFLVSVALPLFIGLPIFIFLFFKQSFREYVTVTYREISGVRVEMDRSNSYLPIWPTLLIGILISAVLIFLSLTPLAYLLLVPFSVYLFGCPDKKKMAVTGALFGAVAIVGIIVAFVV